jgi:hypothetical protein
LKRQSIKVKAKVPPHRLPPRSDSPANQPINEVYAQMRTPARNKTIAKEYMQAIIQWVSTSCNYLTSIYKQCETTDINEINVLSI